MYNGNIAQAQWRTASTDNTLKSYGYTYDALNRITSATDNSGNYDVSNITYDKMGNILTLTRDGWQDNRGTIAYPDMDILDYDYGVGNKLTKVSDTGNGSYGFKDGTNTNDDFVYDANGNMTSDQNKGITGITYNHLNLPTSIDIDGGNISYVYDAAGTKLEKETSTGTITEYAGNYIYEGNTSATTLQFFSHPEGYVNVENNGYRHVYQYKDHLGNVRVSYTEDPTNPGSPTIIEENNYYPFGLKHRGYNTGGDTSLGNDVAQKWKYNDQEFEESLGLNVVEMDFRQYEPSLGRFYNPDRLADLAPSLTPFRFAFNNPVYWSDPSGLYEIDKDGNIVVNNENGNEEVAKLLDYLKNNEGASVDDIAGHIFSSGDFAFDLDEVTVTAGSPSSEFLAVNSIGNQVQSGLNSISNFNGNINFTKERNFAEWAWDNKRQIGVTAGAALNAYAGYNEIVAGLGMMAAPTGATQVAGGYAVLDGAVRIGSAPFQIWGTWTGNTSLENAPSNLLGSIGFLIDSGVEGDWKTGGKAHLTMELMGDFGLSRRKLIELTTKGFTSPNKWKNVINIGNATYQIVRPYKDAIQMKKDGKL